MDLSQIIITFVCLALGGVLKGATGAGAPVLAVPALAMMFDVQFAVIVMLMPNLLTNLWQAWQCREDLLAPAFLARFALSGGLGVGFGTFVLAVLSQEALSVIVALAVFGYIALRFARPDWIVSYPLGLTLSAPLGFVAGMLQGASGLSAPVSLTFLNAMRLERRVFMGTISVFFSTMSVVQIPTLGMLGLLTPIGLAISLAAMLPILLFMPAGAMLARRFSRTAFDRVMLALLAVLAMRLLLDALAGI